jgi:AbrB family looped-hinge helix DNA binding protein
MTHIVRQLRGGQITIPADLRRELGLEDNSLLRVSAEKGALQIRPVRVTDQHGSPWLEELYDLFAPAREEAKKLPERELDEAIDEAIREVRRSQQ